MTKSYHDPDIRTSIDDQTHPPKQWLDPDIRRRIIDHRGSEGYQIDSNLAEDIDAITDTGGGGGGDNVLQLDGENLQLGGEDLTLGA